jgi:PDZ domain-containing protein
MDEFGRNVDRGYKVAATGELELDGTVVPIGAVKQKTIGARQAGVDVFLVPAGSNAREARRYADGLRIIPVKSFPQALSALATLPSKARMDS